MDPMDLEVLMDIVNGSFNLGLCYAEAELEQITEDPWSNCVGSLRMVDSYGWKDP